MTKKKYNLIILTILILLISNTLIYADSEIIYQRKDKDILSNMSQYKLSEDILNVQIGDSIFFGNYESDNIIANGKEPIEWIVLNKDDNKRIAILITNYIIECLPFHYAMSNVTWDNSSLRNYLNNSMIKEMFTDEEIECILDTEIATNPNHYNGLSSGADTVDKLYIPSIDDMYQFFSDHSLNEKDKWYELLKPNENRACKATLYAIARGVRCIISKGSKSFGNGNYFLRTIGLTGNRKWYNNKYVNYFQSYVSEHGEIMPSGTGINSADDGIRIMMRVSY